MQTVHTGKARRWSTQDTRRAIEAPRERTPFYANRERAPLTHAQRDDNFILRVAVKGAKRIQWKHASWSAPRQVAPYQRRDDFVAKMPRNRRIVVRGVEVVEATPTEALDSNALAMVREATQEARENQAKQTKLKALFDMHRRGAAKPDGHSKWCGCHPCKVAKLHG